MLQRSLNIANESKGSDCYIILHNGLKDVIVHTPYEKLVSLYMLRTFPKVISQLFISWESRILNKKFKS